jgi:SAM-dependent methyltransferase
MTNDDRLRQMASVFDRSAPTYDSVIPFFAHFGRRLVELAELRSGERVLDVGTGRGASAFPAAELVGTDGSVVAIDLSPEMIRHINAEREQRGVTNIDARVADAQELNFKNEFDVALSGSALHIVPDPGAVIEGIHAALNAGGRVVVCHPTGGGEEWNFFGDVLRAFAPRAQRPLEPPPSPPDLGDLLSEAGFTDLEITEEVGEFTFEDEEAWWRWVWSQGMRAFLEAFDDDVLEEVRAEMFQRVSALRGPEGIPLHQKMRYLRGRRP